MYVKSVLAGVSALLVASVLYLYIYAFCILPRFSKAPPGMGVVVSVRTVFGQPLFLLIALLAFALAFYWNFAERQVERLTVTHSEQGPSLVIQGRFCAVAHLEGLAPRQGHEGSGNWEQLSGPCWNDDSRGGYALGFTD
jgi:hypothetical protein